MIRQSFLAMLGILSACQPDGRGGESVRLSHVLDSIAAQVATGRIPSLGLAVIGGDGLVLDTAFGWADSARSVLASTHTLYGVGSVTKSITATATFVAAARGLVHLDTPLPPDLVRDPLNLGAVPTLRDALSMGAGLPHVVLHASPDTVSWLTAAGLLRRWGAVIVPDARRAFHYSNLSYAVPEALIERATGRPFEDFLRHELFEPLGMTDATLDPRRGGVTPAVRWHDGAPAADYRFLPAGGAGLYLSIHDLLRFAAFHLRHPLVRPERPGLEPAASRLSSVDDTGRGSYRRYAAGWGNLHTGSELVLVSDGRVLGGNAAILLVPEAGLAAAAAGNFSGGDTFIAALALLDSQLPGIARRALARLETLEAVENANSPTTLPSSLQGDWCGSVRADGLPALVTVRIRPTGTLELVFDSLAASVDAAFDDRPDTIVSGIRFRRRVLRGEGRAGTARVLGQDGAIEIALWPFGHALVGEVVVTRLGARLPYPVRLERAPKPSSRSGPLSP